MASPTCSFVRAWLAPGTTIMVLSPVIVSTTIGATPVGIPGGAIIFVGSKSTPAVRKLSNKDLPWASCPTCPTKMGLSNAAAATAWLAPLPPQEVWKSCPMTVSPMLGTRAVYAVKS